jgi:hypothetical protein
METHEESVASYRSSLQVRNLITDEGDPDRRNDHTGPALIFSISAVTFNLQNPSIIPAYPMALFIGFLC